MTTSLDTNTQDNYNSNTIQGSKNKTTFKAKPEISCDHFRTLNTKSIEFIVLTPAMEMLISINSLSM